MGTAVLFCLALSVCSASAWSFHSWWPWSRPECGQFYSWEVLGLNYTNIINDVKRNDANSDGFVTFAENSPPPPEPTNTTNTGTPVGLARCLFVTDQVSRNKIDRDTANYVFDIIDRNNDSILNGQDNGGVDAFNEADVDKDGKVSVCELMGSYVRTIEKAHRQMEAFTKQLRKLHGETNSSDGWYSYLMKKFNLWFSDWL